MQSATIFQDFPVAGKRQYANDRLYIRMRSREVMTGGTTNRLGRRGCYLRSATERLERYGRCLNLMTFVSTKPCDMFCWSGVPQRPCRERS